MGELWVWRDDNYYDDAGGLGRCGAAETVIAKKKARQKLPEQYQYRNRQP